MGNIVISPNIKKESVRIDINGNEIDPRTKRVIKPVEKPFIPSPEMVKPAEQLAVEQPKSLNIEDMISKKIEALIEKKVNDVLEKLLK